MDHLFGDYISFESYTVANVRPYDFYRHPDDIHRFMQDLKNHGPYVYSDKHGAQRMYTLITRFLRNGGICLYNDESENQYELNWVDQMFDEEYCWMDGVRFGVIYTTFNRDI